MIDATRRQMVWGLLLGGAWLVTGTASAETPAKVYGAGVSQKDVVAVKALLEQPERYVGKTVRVEGVVSAVCQSMGCWLEISDPAIGRGVRFKVQDGVIVFPKDAAGKKASAEGVFEQIATSPVREAHQEHARAKDATGVPAPAAPTEKIYWVRASGAVLY
jgi:hypothetical protein